MKRTGAKALDVRPLNASLKARSATVMQEPHLQLDMGVEGRLCQCPNQFSVVRFQVRGRNEKTRTSLGIEGCELRDAPRPARY